MAKGTQKTQGEAYAIFNSSASREQIQNALRNAPNSLEITVRDTQEFLRDPTTDPKVLEYIHQSTIYPTFRSDQQAEKARAEAIRMRDLKYVMKARLTGADNMQTADWMGDIVNKAIYEKFDHPRPFAADIFFEHEGEICYRTE